MDQQCQGMLSMNQTTITTKDYSMTPVPWTKNIDETHHVYMIITNLSQKLYSDQTVRFPVTSGQGNCYVVIFYSIDGNHIKSYPIKSQNRNKLLNAYEEVYSYLIVLGYLPQLQK